MASISKTNSLSKILSHGLTKQSTYEINGKILLNNVPLEPDKKHGKNPVIAPANFGITEDDFYTIIPNANTRFHSNDIGDLVPYGGDVVKYKPEDGLSGLLHGLGGIGIGGLAGAGLADLLGMDSPYKELGLVGSIGGGLGGLALGMKDSRNRRLAKQYEKLKDDYSLLNTRYVGNNGDKFEPLVYHNPNELYADDYYMDNENPTDAIEKFFDSINNSTSISPISSERKRKKKGTFSEKNLPDSATLYLDSPEKLKIRGKKKTISSAPAIIKLPEIKTKGSHRLAGLLRALSMGSLSGLASYWHYGATPMTALSASLGGLGGYLSGTYDARNRDTAEHYALYKDMLPFLNTSVLYDKDDEYVDDFGDKQLKSKHVMRTPVARDKLMETAKLYRELNPYKN